MSSNRRIVNEHVEFDGFTFPADTFSFVNTCATKRDSDVYDERSVQ